MIDYIFNDLSTKTLLADQATADSVMDNFVDVLKASREIGIKPTIRAHIKLDELELTAGYYVSSWCDNQSVSRERRLYIKRLITMAPIFTGMPDQIVEDSKEVEVSIDGEMSHNLTVAHLTNNPVISFSSQPKWEPGNLEITVRRLNPQTANIDQSEATLLNFSNKANLTANKPRVEKILLTRFKSIEHFWTVKENIFQNLEFAPDVIKSLATLSVSSPVFHQAISKLNEMNSYCETWEEGPCLVQTVVPHITGESETTMQEFRQDRLFKDKDGNHRLCELHARLTPGAWRLHFFPLDEQKKVFIGYIGEKLRTSKYKT